MELVHSFLKILIPLLIIMDPLGNLGPFLALTERDRHAERNRIARTAAVTAGLILVFFCLTGDYVLLFFAISLPAFQLAGGFVFFVHALQMLNLIGTGFKTSSEEEEERMTRQNVALVPLATPLLAGPGAITAVLVWRDQSGQSVHLTLLLLSILISCTVVYGVFRFGARIFDAIGISGIRVVTRLLGLLLAVIAVQFMVTGFQQIQSAVPG